MRRSRSWLLVALAFGAVQAAPLPVAAQGAPEREQAKAAFRAGASAYAAGDYMAAIQALETAYELTPLPAIAFSLAQAERKQFAASGGRDHLERAVLLFRRYLEQEPGGPRRADAALALSELEPQLGANKVGEISAKSQARPTRLVITSDTPGARISLDGGPPSGAPLVREVTPGKHRARVVARGYEDAEREVTAIAGELLLTEVHLSESRSPLYVWAPAGADVYVDGAFVAQAGPLVTVPLRSGRHHLVVAQAGKRVVQRNVRMVHGRPHTEVITLEPTVMREISEYFFIGGGAALGAGVILSALAARSQNRAEDFLGSQGDEELGNAQLLAYQASIIGRNRYRTAATIGVAGSFGLFVTGLFLHELDRPNLAAIHRRWPAGGRDDAGAQRPRLRFSPSVATGDPGASLQVSF